MILHWLAHLRYFKSLTSQQNRAFFAVKHSLFIRLYHILCDFTWMIRAFHLHFLSVSNRLWIHINRCIGFSSSQRRQWSFVAHSSRSSSHIGKINFVWITYYLLSLSLRGLRLNTVAGMLAGFLRGSHSDSMRVTWLRYPLEFACDWFW